MKAGSLSARSMIGKLLFKSLRTNGPNQMTRERKLLYHLGHLCCRSVTVKFIEYSSYRKYINLVKAWSLAKDLARANFTSVRLYNNNNYKVKHCSTLAKDFLGDFNFEHKNWR